MQNITKTIFLDTCYLQKWSRDKLPSTEDTNFLEELKNAGYTFVFTFFNLLETAEQDDLQQVNNAATFMESLPHKWILTSHERRIQEINNIKCQVLYGKNILSDEFPFTTDFTKLINPSIDALLVNNFIRAKSILDKINILKQNNDLTNRNNNLSIILPIWLEQNKMAQEEHSTSAIHKKAIKTLYNKKLEEMIISNPNIIHIEEPRELDELFNHIQDNFINIPSFTIRFYIEHEMLRKINMKWKPSDLADLEHSTVIPYTHLAVLDKNFYYFIQQTTKKYPNLFDNKNHLVAGSIKELHDKYKSFKNS